MNTSLRFAFLFAFLLAGLITNGQELDTKQAPLPCVDKTFSVVAHIIRDSFGAANVLEEDILAAIDTASLAFEPICMGFELCEFRYIDNFQYDTLNRESTEWEELQVKYHVPRRINLFFVQNFGEDQPYICGFAGLGQIANLESSGIVIRKGDCIEPGSKTVIHELGHYFSLQHTFEGMRNELVDGSNCATTGDEICDTPADPFLVGEPVANYVDEGMGCRFILSLRDTNGDWYAPHVGNYMSYYPSSCACGFTYQQYIRMANTFLNAEDKMW